MDKTSRKSTAPSSSTQSTRHDATSKRARASANTSGQTAATKTRPSITAISSASAANADTNATAVAASRTKPSTSNASLPRVGATSTTRPRPSAQHKVNDENRPVATASSVVRPIPSARTATTLRNRPAGAGAASKPRITSSVAPAMSTKATTQAAKTSTAAPTSSSESSAGAKSRLAAAEAAMASKDTVGGESSLTLVNKAKDGGGGGGGGGDRDRLKRDNKDYHHLVDAPGLGLEASSPRKLEIRSAKSADPLAKSSALPHADGEGQPVANVDETVAPRTRERDSRHSPSRAVRHTRAQSERVGHMFGVDRDALPTEVTRLQTEIARLERENRQGTFESPAQQLDGSAPSSQPSQPNMGAGSDSAASKRHADELEALRAAHDIALESLKASCTAELEAVKSELDNHLYRSSQLDGVDTKIEAVQTALRNAKQNEQELQQEVIEKAQDRDQLAKVVEELKQEIDRCQLKLDDDSRMQAKEQEEARQMAEKLQQALEDEQTRCRAAVNKADKCSTELKDAQERFMRELQELRERDEQKTAELRATAANADRLRGEVEISHQSMERNRSALESSTNIITGLEETIERLEKQHLVQVESLREQVKQAQEVEATLRSTHEREVSEERQLGQRAEEELVKLRDEVHCLRQEVEDKTQILEKLESEIRSQEHLNRDAKAKQEAESTLLSQEVTDLLKKVDQRDSLIEAMCARTSREGQESGTLIQELQGEIVKLRQELDDSKRMMTESTEALESRIAQLQGKLELAEDIIDKQDASSREQQAKHLEAMDDMKVKVFEAEQALKAADSRAKDTETELALALESVQVKTQALQQELYSEQSLTAKSAQQLQESRLRCENHQEEYTVLMERAQALEEQYSVAQARVHELSRLLSDAEQRNTSAAEVRESLENDLKHSQGLVLQLQEQVDEKDAGWAMGSARLRNEMTEELRSLREVHTKEFEAFSQEVVVQHEHTVTSLRTKVDALLAEKASLEKELGEIHRQHNRELEENTQKHEVAYRELQDSYRRLKSAQHDRATSEAATSSAAQEELRGVISTLREEHYRAMSELRRIEDQSQQSEAVRISLQTSLEELKAEHQKAVQYMTDDHARRMAEVGNAHAVELRNIEKLAADKAVAAAMHEAEQRYERATVAMAEEHGQKMQQMVASIAEVEAAAIREAGAAAQDQARGHESAMQALSEKYEAITAALRVEIAEMREQYASSQREDALAATVTTKPDLSHVFVNHDAVSKAEHSEQQLDHGFDGRRQDASLHEVVSQLSNSDSELPSSTTSQRYGDDPFRSPAECATQSCAPHTAQAPNGHGFTTTSSSATLEGTLASLRLQTEHLLEVNHDFLDEQERWCGRLGLQRACARQPLSSSMTTAS